jgi:hypothetical protein
MTNNMHHDKFVPLLRLCMVPQVQYPDALPTMSLDLSNIRLAAAFLSKTEIKFDLVSAVDELAAQVSGWLAGC